VIAAESEVAQSEFLKEAAAQLGLSISALASDFERYRRHGARRPPARPRNEEAESPPIPRGPTTISPEEHLLLICLHFEAYGKPLSLALPHEWIDTQHPAGALLNRILAEFEQDAWPGTAELNESGLLETPEEKALAATLLFDTPTMDDPAKVAEEGLQKLRLRALQPQLRQIELALSQSQTDSQFDVISLLKERSELQRQLRQPLRLAPVV